MLDLNDIRINKGLVVDKAGNVISDLSTINVDVAPKYVLFSPHTLPDTTPLAVLHCASFASLVGATFLFHYDEALGYDKTWFATSYRMLDLCGLKYTVVTTKDLPYESTKFDERYYMTDAGVQECFIGYNDEPTRRYMLSKIAYNYPNTVHMTADSMGNYLYLHEQGVPTMLTGNRYFQADDSYEKMLHLVTGTSAIHFGFVASAYEYDSVDKFDDSSINIAIAKSAKEMTFQYATDALQHANTNDCCLIYKKLGFKW